MCFSFHLLNKEISQSLGPIGSNQEAFFGSFKNEHVFTAPSVSNESDGTVAEAEEPLVIHIRRLHCSQSCLFLERFPPDCRFYRRWPQAATTTATNILIIFCAILMPSNNPQHLIFNLLPPSVFLSPLFWASAGLPRLLLTSSSSPQRWEWCHRLTSKQLARTPKMNIADEIKCDEQCQLYAVVFPTMALK